MSVGAHVSGVRVAGECADGSVVYSTHVPGNAADVTQIPIPRGGDGALVSATRDGAFRYLPGNAAQIAFFTCSSEADGAADGDVLHSSPIEVPEQSGF